MTKVNIRSWCFLKHTFIATVKKTRRRLSDIERMQSFPIHETLRKRNAFQFMGVLSYY